MNQSVSTIAILLYMVYFYGLVSTHPPGWQVRNHYITGHTQRYTLLTFYYFSKSGFDPRGNNQPYLRTHIRVHQALYRASVCHIYAHKQPLNSSWRCERSPWNIDWYAIVPHRIGITNLLATRVRSSNPVIEFQDGATNSIYLSTYLSNSKPKLISRA